MWFGGLADWVKKWDFFAYQSNRMPKRNKQTDEGWTFMFKEFILGSIATLQYITSKRKNHKFFNYRNKWATH